MIKLNKWFAENPSYYKYFALQKVISEWGYDSEKTQFLTLKLVLLTLWPQLETLLMPILSWRFYLR